VSPEHFSAWVSAHEGRYELVDGEIVMLAPATRRHDRIVVNLLTSFHAKLRGGPYRTFTAQTYVATAPTTLRMPDLGIDRGKEDSPIVQPSLLVEVVSSAMREELVAKLTEYRCLSSLDYIMVVDVDLPRISMYSRYREAWGEKVCDGLDSIVECAKLGVALSMRDIYSGVELMTDPSGSGQRSE
jgi:Uma2 family endonuclease